MFDRHPLSAMFGDLSPEDRASLLEDIRRNGLTDPEIVLYDGKVLDGWHRYNAARALNIDFTTRGFAGDDAAAMQFVMSRNAHRRHMSKSQLACAIVRATPEAQRGGDRIGAKGTECLLFRKTLAQQAGVSESFVRDASAVHRADPALFAEVLAGVRSLADARDLVRKKPKRDAELAEHQADVRQTVEDADRYGRDQAMAIRNTQHLAAEAAKIVKQAEAVDLEDKPDDPFPLRAAKTEAREHLQKAQAVTAAAPVIDLGPEDVLMSLREKALIARRALHDLQTEYELLATRIQTGNVTLSNDDQARFWDIHNGVDQAIGDLWDAKDAFRSLAKEAA